MTVNTIARQPKGIPVGGQFAATQHGESSVSLSPSGLDAEQILALASSHTGPGVVPELERQLDQTRTPEGRELLLQVMDSRYNRESQYRVDSYPGAAPNPNECEALAALGYTDVNQFARENTKNLSGTDSIIRDGIDPERLEVLNRMSRHEYQWSGWEKEAYLKAPLEDLGPVVDGAYPNAADRYLDTVSLLHPERADRVREALALKVGDKGMIESGQPMETLAGIRDALPESKRNAMHVVGLAERGINRVHLKRYGAQACEKFDGDDLDASGLQPAVIKSFIATGVRPDLDGMRELHAAGYTKGSDLKAASQAMGTTDPKVLADARKHATGEQLAAFGAASRNNVTPHDAAAIGRLVKLGINHPDQLRIYDGKTCAEANQLASRNVSPYDVYAGLVRSKVTPQRLGELSRAGIPADEAYRFVDSKDEWSDGQAFRDKFAAQEATSIMHAPRPWPFTRDSFRTAGTTEA